MAQWKSKLRIRFTLNKYIYSELQLHFKLLQNKPHNGVFTSIRQMSKIFVLIRCEVYIQRVESVVIARCVLADDLV